MRRAVHLSIGAVLLLSACADTATVKSASSPRAGFAAVGATTRSALGAQTVWLQSAADVEENAKRVQDLIQGKTIGPDRAVQVALLNNRSIQAAYADLGLSAADLWDTARGPIPTLSLSLAGLNEGGVTKSLEAMFTASLLDLVTQKRRTVLVDLTFRQAQLGAIQKTLSVAHETRRAWIESVAAFETAGLIGAAQGTADAASELASELGRTGAMNKADQAREHVFTAELAGERADARLEAQLAKERLIRLMGLWGSGISITVPDRLPALPGGLAARNDIERLALLHRVDLAAGRLELERIVKEYKLTQTTRVLSDVSIMAGGEVTRAAGTSGNTRSLTIEFEIPVYDSGKLNKRRGELVYMRAANELAQDAVNARSEARAAYAAVTGKYRIARHWRDAVLPLRRKIDEESLLSYNGMLTSTFELLTDARDGLEAQLSTAAAKRDYWLAEADATAVIWGGAAMGENQ